jgi:hypothetical protein
MGKRKTKPAAPPAAAISHEVEVVPDQPIAPDVLVVPERPRAPERGKLIPFSEARERPVPFRFRRLYFGPSAPVMTRKQEAVHG